jgi:hypothetical protein
MKPTEEILKPLEAHAFYESGLSAHGCLEKLDTYAIKAIERYGRILLKSYTTQKDKTSSSYSEALEFCENKLAQIEKTITKHERLLKKAQKLVDTYVTKQTKTKHTDK